MQPIFSPSILVDIMKPDGSSAIPVLTGESLPADLAYELMGIQVRYRIKFILYIHFIICFNGF